MASHTLQHISQIKAAELFCSPFVVSTSIFMFVLLVTSAFVSDLERFVSFCLFPLFIGCSLISVMVFNNLDNCYNYLHIYIYIYIYI